MSFNRPISFRSFVLVLTRGSSHARFAVAMALPCVGVLWSVFVALGAVGFFSLPLACNLSSLTNASSPRIFLGGDRFQVLGVDASAVDAFSAGTLVGLVAGMVKNQSFGDWADVSFVRPAVRGVDLEIVAKLAVAVTGNRTSPKPASVRLNFDLLQEAVKRQADRSNFPPAGGATRADFSYSGRSHLANLQFATGESLGGVSSAAMARPILPQKGVQRLVQNG